LKETGAVEKIPRPQIFPTLNGRKTARKSVDLPRINWGRGRLLPYESMAAFTAKFCVLNNISCSQCRSFFSELTGLTDWYTTSFFGRTIRVIARLLDETELIVKTLSVGKLVLPACYGTFSFENQKVLHFEEVSYCPECIQQGYHASFHEVSWLRQCPIHRADLIHRCVSHVGGARFDAYVKELLKIFSSVTENWLNIDEQSGVKSFISSLTFREFFDWIKSVCLFTESSKVKNVVSIYGRGYTDQDIGILLGRLEWNCPLPIRLSEIFQKQPYRQEPIISECSVKAVRHLKNLLATINYTRLLEFFRRTAILNNDAISARKLIINAIAKLRKSEKYGKSNWGWKRYIGWVSVDPDDWPYWQTIKDSEYLFFQLQQKWLDFIDEDASPHRIDDAWYGYREYAREFHEKGIVTSLHDHLLDRSNFDVFSRIQPLVNFSIEPGVRKLLEQLLFYEATIDVETICHWLKSIRRGRSPYEFSVETLSYGNLFLEEEKAYFITWPRKRQSL
jgi:hypothetical protein